MCTVGFNLERIILQHPPENIPRFRLTVMIYKRHTRSHDLMKEAALGGGC